MLSIKKLFYPKSVLLYGVSNSLTNLAKYTLMNLLNFKFNGDIYLLGSKSEDINGKKIYTNIDEINEVPDVAIILVPAKMVASALLNCGKKGIKFAVIQTGGFSEFKKGGKDLEKEMLEIAKTYEMRFAGPNCIGMINTHNGLVEPFFPVDKNVIKKGKTSFIAQSGGIVLDAIRFFDANCIGMSKLFSIGNKTNLNENDYLSFLIDDKNTDKIGFYLESFLDGRKFLELAKKSKKPIACLKANRVPLSNQIASFHTSALAGDDAIADIALKQAGVYRAQTLSDMVEFFKLSKLPKLKGKKIGVICRSGGQAVTFADVVGLYGFKLAKFSDSLFKFVNKRVRAGVIQLTNPMDLGDVLDENLYIEIMEKAICEDGVDALVFGYVYLSEIIISEAEEFIRQAHLISFKYNKPIYVYIASSKSQYFNLREVAPFPIFTNENQLFSILKDIYELEIIKAKDKSDFKTIKQTTKISNKGILSILDSYELLKEYKIPYPPYFVTDDKTKVVESKLGFPVALKIADSEVLHKTEKKGVILNIKNSEELKKATMQIDAKTLIVQKMASSGYECFIGGKQDAEFGPVIFFGMGGIYVELIKDVSMRLAPINARVAEDMIKETKVYKLLKGFRKMEKGDIKALSLILVKVSNMLYENQNIINLDINPIIVFPKGCSVIDIKVEMKG